MLRRKLSAWLCPEAHKDAARYRRLQGQLDEARWWLGATHPEAASLADLLLRQDRHHWDDEPAHGIPPWTPPSNPWTPPVTVWGINAFRSWLDSKPFSAERQS